MGMMQEFRDFAVKGNVVDLAVGVIIGAAFGKIVDSLVKDLIMPVVGFIFGGLDFSNMFIQLGKVPANYTGALTYDALTKAGVPLFAYGNFITILLNFIILAFVVFQLVRVYMRFKGNLNLDAAAAPAAPPAPSEVYLKEIRDALTKK
jgi:large conductance mechanosensitive channel